MPPEPDDAKPLRLLIYDRTCRGRRLLPGLSHAWGLGATLFSWAGRFDARLGVASWGEALDWLAHVHPERPIGEVQYWGHGKWGEPRVAKERMCEAALLRDHEMCAGLDAVAARMLKSDRGLWWFRTCETFGAELGHYFAAAFADRMGCRAAGHTFIIGPIQSGLHSVMPGETPSWSPDEALLEGTAAAPLRAAWSGLRAPNTITFLHHDLPQGY